MREGVEDVSLVFSSFLRWTDFSNCKISQEYQFSILEQRLMNLLL